MNSPTVNKADWPAEADWPKAGWQHALNYQQYRPDDVFSFIQDGRIWTGIVEEIGTCAVKIKDILLGVLDAR